MPRIIVDADACPKKCMEIIRRYQKELGFAVTTVSSFNHNIQSEDHITVGNEPDAADLAIVNRTQPGDLVVTQDWGLAALILSKRAHAISPTGQVYAPDSIDFLLEERAVKAKHRRAGGRTRGPSARTAADDKRFETAFLDYLRERN